ncbi:YrvL family regulatory protein [Marinilactibacillus psychrotolerans]|uniref:YrvL family regulatory protein n=1 Tax=Marinilactibacillus psychrotolerans TaxID=191770 RepID=UPI0037FC3A7E
MNITKEKLLNLLGIFLVIGIMILFLFVIPACLYGWSISFLGIEVRNIWQLIIFVTTILIGEFILDYSINQIPQILYELDKINKIHQDILTVAVNYTTIFLVVSLLDRLMDGVFVPLSTRIFFPAIPLVFKMLFPDEKGGDTSLEDLDKELIRKINRLLSNSSVFETVRVVKQEYPEMSLSKIKSIVEKIHHEDEC